MSSMSDAIENDFLAYYFSSGSIITRPTAWYMSLHTADPGDTGTSEVAAASYVRESLGTGFTAIPSGGVATNLAAVTFDTPLTSWGTITHFGVWTASSGGTLLTYGALTSPSSIVAGIGVVLTFAIGTITVTAL